MCQIAIYTPIGMNESAPDALQITVTVNALKRQGMDVRLMRFEDAPDAYTDNRTVEEVLLRDGPDVFPITVVDGEVLQKNNFPQYGELLAWSAGAPMIEK